MTSVTYDDKNEMEVMTKKTPKRVLQILIQMSSKAASPSAASEGNEHSSSLTLLTYTP